MKDMITEVKFKDLEIGQEFFCDKGDFWFENRYYLRRISEDLAKDLNGITHFMGHNTIVYIDSVKI